jgi:cell division protein FtsB
MSSSDVLEQIRASRPVAPATLRDRVQALTAGEEPASPPTRLSRLPQLPRLRLRRVVLVAAPGFAVLAVATAGVIGFARSGEADRVVSGATREEVGTYSTTTGPTDTGVLQAAGPPAAADSATTEAAKGGAVAPAPSPGRLERYQAFLRLRVEDANALSDATQRALRLTRELGGYVVSLQSNVPEVGTGGAEIVVRVPRARVQEAVVGFSELGTILAQQVQIEDLQRQVDELGDRIATLNAEISRILRQLARPNLPAETRATLTVRLSQARRELQELRTSREQTTREGELATVSLSLTTEESSAAAPADGRFDRAVDRALEVLEWEAAAVLLALVAVGPVAVLAVLIWLGLRITRRRAEERLLERA